MPAAAWRGASYRGVIDGKSVPDAAVHASVRSAMKPPDGAAVSRCDDADAGDRSAAVRRLTPFCNMESIMSKGFALLASAAFLAFAAVAPAPLFADSMKEKTVNVGGAPMYPSKNIVQNAVNSKDHTTLVAAVKAAGLVDTLQGPGPFTVFAPINSAF